MLAGNRNAAVNRGLGDIDSACRQADGATHRAVADREGIARGDDIAVDGHIIQVEGLTGQHIILNTDSTASCFYAEGETVALRGSVKSAALAGDTVTIDGTVNGDVEVWADKLILGNRLACRVKTVGGAIGVEHDVLACQDRKSVV